MAYGTIKVDNIIFDNGGVDKLLTVSGLFYSTSGALTVTGTVSGGNVTAPTATFTTLTGTTTAGTTATFTSGSFTTLTGTTVTGTTVNFTGGNFVTLSGTTTTISSGIFAAGSATAPSVAVGTGTTYKPGIYSPGTDQLALATAGTGRLFVDSSGRLGIGTSPSAILHTASAESGILGANIPGNIYIESNTTAASGVGGGIVFGGAFNGTTTTVAAGIKATKSNGTAGDYSFDLAFYTRANATAGSEKFRIDSIGNVGIGVTPSAWTGSGKNLEIGSAANIINAAANDFSVNLNATYNAGWKYGTATFASRYQQASGQHIWYTALSGTAGAAISFTQAMTLDASGRLGIGTTGPAYKNEVVVASDTSLGATGDGIVLSGTLSGGNRPIGLLHTGSSYSYNGVGSSRNCLYSNNTLAIQADGGNLEFCAGANLFAILTAAGRFGIGTTNPVNQLHAVSAGNTPGQLQTTGGTACYLYLSNTGGGAYLSSQSDGLAFHISGAATERMRIDSSGRLLVGTSSTSGSASAIQIIQGFAGINNTGALLLARSSTTPVDGDGLGEIVFGDSGHTRAAEIRVVRDGGTWTSGTSQPTRLVFSTTASGSASPTERMRIDSSGNVGIGVTPSAWGANYKALQISPWTTLLGNNNNGSMSLSNNAYVAGAGGGVFTYIGTGTATTYTQNSGAHYWYTAPSGTAGTAISFTQAMALNNTGSLTVNGATSVTGGTHTIQDSGSSPNTVRLYNNTDSNNTTNRFLICDAGASVLRAEIRSNGGLANYSANNANLSDRNAKKDISPAADTWNRIKKWEIVNYRYRDQPDDADLNLGVIAQQVAESCPEVITIFEEAKDNQPEKLGIKEQQMYWMAIKALQEAQARIETLEAKVAALESA